jgi:heme-degrading monooxygenase HmoA
MRVKAGMEAKLDEELRAFEQAQVPGSRAVYIYRMDADPSAYYMAVVFDSREAYVANANSPEQDQRYQRLRALLAAEPEWHDGEIIHAMTQ